MDMVRGDLRKDQFCIMGRDLEDFIKQDDLFLNLISDGKKTLWFGDWVRKRRGKEAFKMRSSHLSPQNKNMREPQRMLTSTGQESGA